MIASNIRASFSALLISLTSALPAFAGDAAYPEAIGFSDDGTRFAFAEWGRQDGSGFAYANLYVIDLAKDAWLGAPVRVLLEDETASPRAAYFSLSWAGDIVHQDQKLPASRGCPVRYSVERIFVEDQTYQPKYAVALIGVYRQGFEGPDLRHMAIPLPLPSR